MAKPNKYRVTVWTSINPDPIMHILDAWTAADAEHQVMLRYKGDGNARVRDIEPVKSLDEELVQKGQSVTIPTGSLITEKTIEEIVKRVNVEAAIAKAQEEAKRVAEAVEKQKYDHRQQRDCQELRSFLGKELNPAEVFHVNMHRANHPANDLVWPDDQQWKRIIQGNLTVDVLFRSTDGKTWKLTAVQQ